MNPVSELDVDVVVAEAPEVVVDRFVHGLLHIALKSCSASHLESPPSPLQSGDILGERPLDDDRLRLRPLATVKRNNRRKASAVIAP